MSARRIAAVALVVVALLGWRALRLDGGSDKAATPGEAPGALWTSRGCDAPSPTVLRVECGWWREPRTRTVTLDGAAPGPDDERTTMVLWDLHYGEVDRMPPRAHPIATPDLARQFLPDQEHVPAAPGAFFFLDPAPWWVTEWWLALILIFAFVGFARLPFLWNGRPG